MINANPSRIIFLSVKDSEQPRRQIKFSIILRTPQISNANKYKFGYLAVFPFSAVKLLFISLPFLPFNLSVPLIIWLRTRSFNNSPAKAPTEFGVKRANNDKSWKFYCRFTGGIWLFRFVITLQALPRKNQQNRRIFHEQTEKKVFHQNDKKLLINANLKGLESRAEKTFYSNFIFLAPTISFSFIHRSF